MACLNLAANSARPHIFLTPQSTTSILLADLPQPLLNYRSNPMAEEEKAEVVIVGAGPVGLIIALNLVKQGISVILLEQYHEVIQSPRAMAYGPAAVYELERSGIAQECRELGMDDTDYDFVMRWITIDNKPVAALESRLLPAKYPPVRCGQHLVAAVILKHLARFPEKVKVLWSHKVVDIEQDENSATAICEVEGGKKVRVSGKYIVGADGAGSSVRKAIGCTFDGFTYDKMVVATNVYYPFQKYGFHRGQFIIHPEHFALVIPVSNLVLIVRLRKCNRMGCTESLMEKTLVFPTKKLVQIWIINIMLCFRDLNLLQGNTTYECFRLTSYINVLLTSSVLDESC